MKLDIIMLAVSLLFYSAQAILFKTHYYIFDVLFFAFFIVRMFFLFKKYGFKDKNTFKPILIAAASAFVPLTFIIKLLIGTTGFDISTAGAFVVSGLMALFIFLANPRLLLTEKQTIKQHHAVIKELKPEPFSTYLAKDFFIPGQQRFLHEQVIGSTGSGKTRYVFYPSIYQDIMNGAGLFIYDIKSNMRGTIEGFVSHSSRDYDYFVFNLGDMAGAKYNPLAGGSASEIANRVFSALYFDELNGNQFYMDIAKRFLFSMISVLKLKFETLTFKDLYICTSRPQEELKDLCLEFESAEDSRYLLNFMATTDKLEEKLLGLTNKLAQYATPEWTKQINTTQPDFKMSDIITKNKILLFQANSGVYQQEYKPISILALMDLQSEIAKRYSMKELQPFFIYLDEFKNIIYKEFSELINKAREAKVGLIFGHQSLGDLETFGDGLKNIILTNSRNKIVLNVENPETASYFAELFGTQTVVRKVRSHKEDGTTAGYTDKLEEEFVIHPNELKTLKTIRETDTTEAVISIETGKGKILRRMELTSVDASEYAGTLQRRPQQLTEGKESNFNNFKENTPEQTTEETQTPPMPAAVSAPEVTPAAPLVKPAEKKPRARKKAAETKPAPKKSKGGFVTSVSDILKMTDNPQEQTNENPPDEGTGTGEKEQPINRAV